MPDARDLIEGAQTPDGPFAQIAAGVQFSIGECTSAVQELTTTMRHKRLWEPVVTFRFKAQFTPVGGSAIVDLASPSMGYQFLVRNWGVFAQASPYTALAGQAALYAGQPTIATLVGAGVPGDLIRFPATLPTQQTSTSTSLSCKNPDHLYVDVNGVTGNNPLVTFVDVEVWPVVSMSKREVVE